LVSGRPKVVARSCAQLSTFWVFEYTVMLSAPPLAGVGGDRASGPMGCGLVGCVGDADSVLAAANAAL
jgi:hypothetical protein